MVTSIIVFFSRFPFREINAAIGEAEGTPLDDPVEDAAVANDDEDAAPRERRRTRLLASSDEED